MNRRPHRFVSAAIVIGLAVSACSPSTVPDPTPTSPHTDLTRIDIQGHRGARGLKPESTLPSFETALDLGVGTLEFDLHYTADDDVVVWHDPIITADKCGVRTGAPDNIPDPDDPASDPKDLAVRALSVADLRWFECNRNPDAERFPDQDSSPTTIAGRDFGIITFSELVEFVDLYAASTRKTDSQRTRASAIRFNIETKREPGVPRSIGDGFDGVNAGPFERRILEVIEAFELSDRVVIQSFDPRSLRAIHAADPAIELAILTAFSDIPFDEIVALGVSIWSPRSSTATQPLIDKAHAAGLTVISWTVNEEEEMHALLARGVDGLITDRPDIALDPSQ